MPTSGNLFEDAPLPRGPSRLGLAVINYKQASSILTPASGFMAGYDFTLNPYSGCAFGCAYCYAAAFSRTEEAAENWGKWVNVKENAIDLIRRSRRPLRGKTIYISSVTDPYQPIEQHARLTRGILEALIPSQPKLVIQTRSPLVARDIDILSEFDTAQVNMTVTTDSEEVRRAFEPGCPSNAQRLAAIAKVQTAGIPSCITMTPLLPVLDARRFADQLLATGVRRFIVQPFHPKKGQFAAGTRDTATPLIERYRWDGAGYLEVRDLLKASLPHLGEGKDGFAPP